MSMAADSNMNFFQQLGGGRGGVFPPSFYDQHVVSFHDQHVVSFQSGAVNSGAGMIQGSLNGGGLIFGGDGGNLGSSASSSMIPVLGNYGNLLVEPLPGLKHDTGLAVDWSFNEQAILNDGLNKFADEPGMMKYIKIAASLPGKTVRDVALRCRWMTKRENVKRRKIEENYAKKIQNKKEKMSDSSTKANMHSVQLDNMAAYSFLLQPANPNYRFSYEVPAIDCATQQLLDENIQVLNQISDNLLTYKLHDNIELLSRTGNNITAILNSMSQMPGIMSQMPPLPAVNEDLLNSILSITSQASIYETPSSINLKQEPR